MDSSLRKRGRPKLCVTKKVLEERRAQKRLQNAARRDPGLRNVQEVAEERNALKRLRNAALRDPGTIILGTITINYKGSPCYMAPEVLKHNYGYDAASFYCQHEGTNWVRTLLMSQNSTETKILSLTSLSKQIMEIAA
ncbi:hypothetical protein ACET3Z_010805 [Daucus carota]